MTACLGCADASDAVEGSGEDCGWEWGAPADEDRAVVAAISLECTGVNDGAGGGEEAAPCLVDWEAADYVPAEGELVL